MPDEISHSYQMMIFWAGLRGAVGVALAMDLVGKQMDIIGYCIGGCCFDSYLVWWYHSIDVGIKIGCVDESGDFLMTNLTLKLHLVSHNNLQQSNISSVANKNQIFTGTGDLPDLQSFRITKTICQQLIY